MGRLFSAIEQDGDGWSDPEDPTSSRPYGWTYNATRCYNSWVDDEGNTRAAGEHCADLYPWAEDDTSAENICGERCDEQWGDRDGDGYGDNNSQGAWNRDAFPLDPTQYEDTDEDGYGDNPDGNNAHKLRMQFATQYALDRSLGLPGTPLSSSGLQ